jgi:hypothetical protein
MTLYIAGGFLRSPYRMGAMPDHLTTKNEKNITSAQDGDWNDPLMLFEREQDRKGKKAPGTDKNNDIAEHLTAMYWG